MLGGGPDDLAPPSGAVGAVPSPFPADAVATLGAMRRRCARPGCAEPAAVTLSYDYRAATVWLESLDPVGHPMTHDLCERHGARTAAPRGWELVDRRATAPASLVSVPPLAS